MYSVHKGIWKEKKKKVTLFGGSSSVCECLQDNRSRTPGWTGSSAGDDRHRGLMKANRAYNEQPVMEVQETSLVIVVLLTVKSHWGLRKGKRGDSYYEMAPLVAREGKGRDERDLLCWDQQLAEQTFSCAVWRKAAGVAANQMTGLWNRVGEGCEKDVVFL